MKETYCLRTDVVCDEEGVPHTVYGMDCMQNGHCIKSVADISCDREKVMAWITLCNAQGLSVAHLPDVLEDFLSCP